MDLILLQPGNSDDIFGETSSTQIDKGWREDSLQFGRCLEQVSVHTRREAADHYRRVSNEVRTSGRLVITVFTCVKNVD